MLVGIRKALCKWHSKNCGRYVIEHLCSFACSIVPLDCTYEHKFKDYTIKNFNTATTLSWACGPSEWQVLSTSQVTSPWRKYKRSFSEATARTLSINTRLLSEGITLEIINIMGGTQNVRKYSIKLSLTGSPPIATQLQPHLSLSLCIKTLKLL